MTQKRDKNGKTGSGSAPPSSEKMQAILESLNHLYPDAHCSLIFSSPLELLIATILSAQCTDERVNRVTPGLFLKYPTAAAYAEAPVEELEAGIRSAGFYHNKAKSIQACCRILAERFDGKVPADLDTLVQLPGIGRKTANVVLANAFRIPSVFVDTHVGRVSQRLGLTRHKDPDKIEQDLMKIIAREEWIRFCHQLVQHGRTLCHSKNPKIAICPLRPYCNYAAAMNPSQGTR